MKKVWFIIIIILFLLSSCANNIITPGKTLTDNIMEEKNDLFIQKETKFYQIKTNNKAYLKGKGYSIWTILNKNESESFEPISVNVAKEDGKSDMGYGIVFAHREEENTITMLCLLINVTGEFCIGKISNGKFKIKKEWTKTLHLLQGYNIENKIDIKWNNEINRFVISFNDKYECELQNEFQTLNNLGWGLVATIAPNEDFDTSFVCVNYKVN